MTESDLTRSNGCESGMEREVFYQNTFRATSGMKRIREEFASGLLNCVSKLGESQGEKYVRLGSAPEGFENAALAFARDQSL